LYRDCQSIVSLSADDLIVDIGSNDGTLIAIACWFIPSENNPGLTLNAACTTATRFNATNTLSLLRRFPQSDLFRTNDVWQRQWNDKITRETFLL